ncbi:hypothetical protein EZY14_002720 [Kordia sp. TARA_039_SRF]|nr:hypothetical protein EZY14_002720 [Kordia sp. TARA_039_SRF]
MAAKKNRKKKILKAVHTLIETGDVEILQQHLETMYVGYVNSPQATNPTTNASIYDTKKILSKFFKRLKKINKRE